MSSQRQVTDRFAQRYATRGADVHRAVQREVFGADTYVNGYTTPAQADLLAQRLDLRPGLRLLDIGAGLGWPSLYLAQNTGCQAVLTDPPLVGLQQARHRAVRLGLEPLCAFALASGTHLPFSPAAFDAVLHTDTL